MDFFFWRCDVLKKKHAVTLVNVYVYVDPKDEFEG